jgi:hypothetical protein
MDPHDVAILSSARATETLAEALCKQHGWNEIDVMSGILWGVVGLCRKIGMTRERIISHVSDCVDSHIVDEHPAKGPRS